MDAPLLSDAYATTPWFVALVDELVDTLHQVGNPSLLFLILSKVLNRYDDSVELP